MIFKILAYAVKWALPCNHKTPGLCCTPLVLLNLRCKNTYNCLEKNTTIRITKNRSINTKNLYYSRISLGSLEF